VIPSLALSYYGDDFTGSTDVMEVLTWAGLHTALFLQPPSAEQLSRFRSARAIGIAGDSRSRSPEWMSEHLPQIFQTIQSFGAPINQYKVCSTFDSSPGIGSIGRALDIGLDVFAPTWAPIVVGAPKLRRYQAFGNLFARIASESYRLDRHPTMSRHPVTPMGESDLRLHLAAQSRAKIGLVDLLALASGEGQGRIAEACSGGERAVLFDVLDEASLIEVGRLIWENRAAAPFAIASSGLEYALVAFWRSAGLLAEPRAPQRAASVDRLAVLSGSCSPETAASIRHAMEHGYAGIPLDVLSVAAGQIDEALQQAVPFAAEGRSFIFYTALGPSDPNLIEGDEAFRRSLSSNLGRLFALALERTGIRRAVVCGGDTSSGVGRQLDLYALTALCPIAPGSPLCRAWSRGPLDGLEISFKGGQVGGPAFFEEVRDPSWAREAPAKGTP
jgi:uncharacterized protein YgbK (DUF1537 family)